MLIKKENIKLVQKSDARLINKYGNTIEKYQTEIDKNKYRK